MDMTNLANPANPLSPLCPSNPANPMNTMNHFNSVFGTDNHEAYTYSLHDTCTFGTKLIFKTEGAIIGTVIFGAIILILIINKINS
jgi:hypothetical protein